jgi:hypothetical protein
MAPNLPDPRDEAPIRDDYEKLCKEWIARRTAQLDQQEKAVNDKFVWLPPSHNLVRLDDLEARRFWVDIHKWELEQMIETGSIDDYPRKSSND